MDLIKEYLDTQGNNQETARKFEKTQKKINLWQKKLKIKSDRKLYVRQEKRKRKLDALSIKSVETIGEDNYSVVFSTTAMPVDDYHAGNIFKLSAQIEPRKSSRTLRNFSKFERKIRRTFQQSYKTNFPDSLEALEEVLNLMFGVADSDFKKCVLVETKPVATVPEVTAKYMNLKSTNLQKIQELVEHDLIESRRLKTLPRTAFGYIFKDRPNYDAKPNDFKSRWKNYSRQTFYNNELESFSAVWKNITHLQSTKRFCLWLAKNPSIAPPSYLKPRVLQEDSGSYDYTDASKYTCEDYDYEMQEQIIKMAFKGSKHYVWKTESAIYSDSLSSLVSVDISDINIIV